MSARDGPEYDDLDVPGSGVSRELASADGPADHPEPPLPGEQESRNLAYAESRQRAEGGWEPRPFKAPRAELARFDPERAALPRISPDTAASYIEQHQATRPWLAAARAASPEARLIIATMDIGCGHGHIRHEGWVTEYANMMRAACLEDPAQLDPAKRSLGIDGLKPNDQPHWCRSTSTRITDPDAFATAFVHGVEHPRIREALSMAFDPDDKPREVTLPIADLLGPDGYRHCTGWRLEPLDGSMGDARANRDAWIAAREAREDGLESDVPEPRARPVPTFEGGVITFVFGRNDAEKRYEILTMFPRPAQL